MLKPAEKLALQCPPNIRTEVTALETTLPRFDQPIYATEAIWYLYQRLTADLGDTTPETVQWIFTMYNEAFVQGQQKVNPKKLEKKAGRNRSHKREHGTGKRGKRTAQLIKEGLGRKKPK